VYSGVSRSRNASTRFQVTLGKLRANQVYVLGDVARPAAYQVSSAGTVLNALYQAGGPSGAGSFRNIEVRRGNQVVQHVDLYDYLLKGDGSSDIRIENQDRIFVPPAGAQVRIEGAVRRPFIYEVKPGEGVRELVAFAGGLNSDAVARRIQIDRILPPGERTPGVVRKLKDVSLAALTQDEPDAVLNDGDVVTVFAISGERRNRVVVDGEVRNPGRYEWKPGLTLGQLLANADGVSETAYTPRILIYRLNEADGTRVVVRASLADDSTNPARSEVALADQDSVVVLSRRSLTNPQFVSIDGFVKHPDTYALADGMTLKDLILSAGGFAHGAYVVEAEVSRLPDPLVRSNTTAIVRRIRLEGTADDSTSKSSTPTTEVPSWYPAADEMVLRHGDRVFIRRAPGYGVVREVKLTGEVALPGTYVLENREERLRDLIERAGGLTREAHAPGMRVVREGRLVAADVSEGLRKKTSRNNIVLEAGDSIHVPTYDPMIAVSGAVTFEARVLHRPGADLDYYIGQAGGYTNIADKGHITVTYPNGERAAMKRFLTARSAPKVVPGSVIFVPTKPADRQSGTNWESVIMRTLTLVTTSATLLIALRQL
jgi:protein involved in polysaccharide export with SLBB domain